MRRRWRPLLLIFLVGLAAGGIWAETVQLVGAPSAATLADFETAAAACTNKRMIVASSQTVSNNTTVAATCDLEFQGAGALNIASGKVVTINGAVLAGRRQIFTGSGTVTFGRIAASRGMTIEWWGAVCDGSTSDTAAVQKAYAALPSDGGDINLCIPSKFGDIAFTTKSVMLVAPSNQGKIEITGPVIWQDQAACGIRGVSAGFGDGTRFEWLGGNDPTTAIAIFQGWSVQQCIFKDISIIAPSNTPFQAAILFAKVRGQGYTLAPRYNIVQNVRINGNDDEPWGGVRYAGGICLGGTNVNKACTNDAAGDTLCATGGGTTAVCSLDGDNSENIIDTLVMSHANGACIEVGHAECLTNNFYNIYCGAALDSSTGWSQCGVATGGGRCTAGDLIGHFCLASADCPGSGTCSTATSPAGHFNVDGGLLSGMQQAVFCYGTSGQPYHIENIDSESSAALSFSGGPTAAPSTFEAQNIRFALNAAGPGRVCREGTNDGTACAADATCTGGGYCSGCTADDLFAVAAGPVTKPRLCCSASGTGADCLKLVQHKTGGSVTIDEVQFKSAVASAAAQQALTFHIDGSGPVTGSVRNTYLPTSATLPFTTSHPTTETWTWSGVVVDNPGSTRSRLAPRPVPSLSLASLPTVVSDGAMVFCNDCLRGSVPCSASSTGAFAKREASAWNCD